MKPIPVLFSYDDFASAYHEPSGFYSFLKRSLKKGTIRQVKRGLYALVDPSTGQIYPDKFQVACRLFDGAYFSYHEALEYYGLATQSFVSCFTYLSHVRVNPVEFNGVTYSSRVSVCDRQILDKSKERGIRVVSLERAIVDSIDNYRLGGGLDEVEMALDNCPKLDLNKIRELLTFYDKAFLYQKVGYLFEKHMKNYIPDEFFCFCESKIGAKRMYLDCVPGKTKLVRRWNLLVKDRGGYPNELF